MPLPSSPDSPSMSSTASGWVSFLTNASSLTPHFLCFSQLPTLELHCLPKEREGKGTRGVGVPLSVATTLPESSLPWLGVVRRSLLSQLIGPAEWLGFPRSCRPCHPGAKLWVWMWTLEPLCFLWGFCFSPHTWSVAFYFLILQRMPLKNIRKTAK